MARLLLVEDDEGIARPLAGALRSAGHEVAHVTTGRDALRTAADDTFDAVVLDLGLPDVDGIEVCRRLRADHGEALAILVLTARVGELDVVVGLDAGADDYVTKPFRLAELEARIRALLRRANPRAEAHTAGPVRVDVAARRAWLDDDELDLTPTEFDVLALLVTHAGEAVTRDMLMRDVWETDWTGSTKALDMQVSALRRKLGDDPAAPRIIHTLRGVGYRVDR